MSRHDGAHTHSHSGGGVWVLIALVLIAAAARPAAAAARSAGRILATVAEVAIIVLAVGAAAVACAAFGWAGLRLYRWRRARIRYPKMTDSMSVIAVTAVPAVDDGDEPLALPLPRRPAEWLAVAERDLSPAPWPSMRLVPGEKVTDDQA